ncbi:anti-repressor SinI family protein [Bacillus dakarensis]|nr:anti-repressor SinI family protein [Bacillus dakarensis]
MIETREIISGLDIEWIKLILEAKKIGLEKEDIREYIEKNRTNNRASM